MPSKSSSCFMHTVCVSLLMALAIAGPSRVVVQIDPHTAEPIRSYTVPYLINGYRSIVALGSRLFLYGEDYFQFRSVAEVRP